MVIPSLRLPEDYKVHRFYCQSREVCCLCFYAEAEPAMGCAVPPRGVPLFAGYTAPEELRGGYLRQQAGLEC